MSKTLISKQVRDRIKGEARKIVQRVATLNKNGEEILDEQPLFLDAGFKQPETMNDKIRRITQQVQEETAAKFAAQNMTPEQVKRILDEEDDFEVPDEFISITTQYEARGLVTQLEDQINFITQNRGSEADEVDADADTQGATPPITEGQSPEQPQDTPKG